MHLTPWRRCRLGLTAVLVVLLAGCATAPEEDPVFIKLNDLDRRLERLERVLSNQSLLELAQQVQTLQAELRSLRGSLEELEHQAGELKSQQRNLYNDLDRRLEALQGSAVPMSRPGAPDPSALPAPGGSDRANYQAAFDLLKNGRYGEATAAFRQFLAAFPDSALAGNAQYWLGESHYVTRRYAEALDAFQAVINNHPGSSKLPDAWLKIGYSRYELKDWRGARAALEQVRREDPDSAAAAEAAARLERMTAEGR